MFESKAGVLLIGGLGFFLFAFLSNAVVPILLYRHMPEQTVQQLVEKNENGETEAWRLDDMTGVRADDNYYTKYIAGAYGARPKVIL